MFDLQIWYNQTSIKYSNLSTALIANLSYSSKKKKNRSFVASLKKLKAEGIFKAIYFEALLPFSIVPFTISETEQDYYHQKLKCKLYYEFQTCSGLRS